MRPSWGSSLSARAWLALPVLAALEVALHFACAARAPTFEAYDALTAPLTALREEGDAIIVTPRWAEPMVRRALGDELGVAAVAGPETGHAVEVSIFGEQSVELDGWHRRVEQRVGPFFLRRFENPHHVPAVTDFVDALTPAGATVSVVPGTVVPGTVVPHTDCMFNPVARPIAGDLGGHPTWPRRRFVCPGPPHVTVGVTVIADERWRPRRCLLAPPPARGELAIRFRGVALGKRLVGHGGLYWMTERARGGAPVQLRVEVDGAEVGTFIHADGDGWSTFEMDLSQSAEKSAAHDVTFFVSSPGDRDRDFCFEARSL